MNAAARTIQTGRLLLACLHERRVPFYSPEKIREIQTRRVRSIVKYAYEHVPYYRDVMRGRSLTPEDIRDADDLCKLPVISNADVRAAQDAFQSRLNPPERCVLLSTTLGGRTYWDAKSALRRMALLERDRVVWTRLARLRPGHTRLVIVARISAVHTQQNFVRARTFHSGLWARREWHDAGLPFSALVETLERVRPEAVFSYGSYVEHFFRYLRSNSLTPGFLPRIWVFSSDTLDPCWRQIIERDYGVPVYSTYAATEMGRIGYECEKRGAYHLNIDSLVIRTVDPGGCDTAPGETGEICISNLLNRGTVLLNHRMSDYGCIASAKCDCGRNLPVLGEFVGKVSVMLTLANGKEVLAPVVLRSFLPELTTALQYQIVVTGVGSATVNIVPGAGSNPDHLRAAIERKARQDYGDNLRIAVEFVDRISSVPGGKFPKVSANVPAGSERT